MYPLLGWLSAKPHLPCRCLGHPDMPRNLTASLTVRLDPELVLSSKPRTTMAAPRATGLEQANSQTYIGQQIRKQGLGLGSDCGLSQAGEMVHADMVDHVSGPGKTPSILGFLERLESQRKGRSRGCRPLPHFWPFVFRTEKALDGVAGCSHASHGPKQAVKQTPTIRSYYVLLLLSLTHCSAYYASYALLISVDREVSK
jgi:hypothetical protein